MVLNSYNYKNHTYFLWNSGSEGSEGSEEIIQIKVDRYSTLLSFWYTLTESDLKIELWLFTKCVIYPRKKVLSKSGQLNELKAFKKPFKRLCIKISKAL